MQLTTEQIREFYDRGYVKSPVPSQKRWLTRRVRP